MEVLARGLTAFIVSFSPLHPFGSRHYHKHVIALGDIVSVPFPVQAADGIRRDHEGQPSRSGTSMPIHHSLTTTGEKQNEHALALFTPFLDTSRD